MQPIQISKQNTIESIEGFLAITYIFCLQGQFRGHHKCRGKKIKERQYKNMDEIGMVAEVIDADQRDKLVAMQQLPGGRAEKGQVPVVISQLIVFKTQDRQESQKETRQAHQKSHVTVHSLNISNNIKDSILTCGGSFAGTL